MLVYYRHGLTRYYLAQGKQVRLAGTCRSFTYVNRACRDHVAATPVATVGQDLNFWAGVFVDVGWSILAASWKYRLGDMRIATQRASQNIRVLRLQEQTNPKVDIIGPNRDSLSTVVGFEGQ